MARVIAAGTLIVALVSGCAGTGGLPQSQAAEVSLTISKPRIDVEHLRSVVVDQPRFTQIVGSEFPTSFQLKQTTAVLCKDVSTIDCQQIAIWSKIVVKMNPSNQRVEGVWHITYGGDVTAEYVVTRDSPTQIRHETGSTQPSTAREIPISVGVGTSASIEGPFDMTLVFSVAK